MHDDTEQVADLTRQLQAEKDACAKMRESLIYGSAGDPMADAEMARLLAERNNLQKQVALLKARIDKSADESRKEQHVSAQLRERIQELENTVQSHVPKSGHESMAVTAKGGEHAGDDVQALKTDLAESRDQVRALSSRDTGSTDEVARLKSTIAALEAQIANDGGTGKLSDPEREALLEGKRAAEESVAHLQRQMRADVEALKTELAESRDQVQTLTAKAQDEADTVRRHESTIGGLEARIANDGETGTLSDPEREALHEAKRAAEERAAHLQRELDRSVATLRDELAEARASHQLISGDGVSQNFGSTSLSSIGSGSSTQGDAEQSELLVEVTSLKHRLAVAEDQHKQALVAHQQASDERNAIQTALAKSESDLQLLKSQLTASHTDTHRHTQTQRHSDTDTPEQALGSSSNHPQLSVLRTQLADMTVQVESTKAGKAASDDMVRKLESELQAHRKQSDDMVRKLESELQAHRNQPARENAYEVSGGRDEPTNLTAERLPNGRIDSYGARVARAEGELSSVFTMLESRRDATPEKQDTQAFQRSDQSDRQRQQQLQEVHQLRAQLEQSEASFRTLRTEVLQGKIGEPLPPTSRIALELEVHELRARLAAAQLDITKDRYINQSSHHSASASDKHEEALQQEIQRLSMQLQSSKVMCNELQARLRSTQTHAEISHSGRDDAIQQLERKLDSANREAMTLRNSESLLQENVLRLERQLQTANMELSQLPNVKAIILDFQRAAETAHRTLQDDLDREKRSSQALRAELAVAVREIEAREVETKLAREHSKGVEAKLETASERGKALQSQLERSQSAVRESAEERAAVAHAGEELERILTELRSNPMSSTHGFASHTSVRALGGVYRALARVATEWAAMQKRTSAAESERERISKELAVAREQLVENTSLSVKQLEDLESAQRDQSARQLAFLQSICLRIDTDCAAPLRTINSSPQVGLSEWEAVAEAVVQQVSRLLSEHQTSAAHLSENATKIARMEAQVNSVLRAAGENEQRATSSTLRLQQELAAQAAIDRDQARQQTEHALDTLRAQHAAQLAEQKKMLADERSHSKQQVAVVVDDYSARLRALEAQVAGKNAMLGEELEKRELHFAAVCAVLVRAIHGLQHQLAELCGTSRVVRCMLRTGTGSNLHKHVIGLVQACSSGTVVTRDGLDSRARWGAPAASFRAAVIAVMAIHRLQLGASNSWRCYGGALQVSSASRGGGGQCLPTIRLWVEEVDMAAVLAALREPGLEADEVAAQLVGNAAVQSSMQEEPLFGRRPGQDLVVGLRRGLQSRCNQLMLAVDRYTPASVAMNELRKSVLGMSEQLCGVQAAEQTQETLQQQLQECLAQLQSDDERMARSEDELRKANEKIGNAKADQQRALAELSEAKGEVQVCSPQRYGSRLPLIIAYFSHTV